MPVDRPNGEAPLEKTIRVRPLEASDYEAVVGLQEHGFPGMSPWSRDQFESHLHHFPDGQIGVEYDGKLVGSSSSLLIEFDEYGDRHAWADITDRGFITNHDPEGDTLYGIEVVVDPQFRDLRLGRRLYEARKDLVRRLNLRRIMVGGRLPGYDDRAEEMSVQDYVERVGRSDLYDPVLTFQLSNGFVVKRIVRNYLPADDASHGYAVLLEWVNLQHSPNPAARTRSTFPVRVCTVQYLMRKIGSWDEFAQQVEYFVDVASGYKADFVLFPEMFTLQLLSFLPPSDAPGQSVRQMTQFTEEFRELGRRLAISYNINIIGGSHYTELEDGLFNLAYLFRRDGSIEEQEKLHITPNEQRWWGTRPGRAQRVFDTDRGRIAINICYDAEFPELARIATEKGAQLLFVPFCTDNRQGHLRVMRCAQARAIENQLFVITAGCVGNIPSVENMDIHYAQSGIFTPSDFPFPPDGVAGLCEPNIETVVFADLDLELLRQNRVGGTVRPWRDRRLDLYEVVEKEPNLAPRTITGQVTADAATTG
ncbi:bifunctional GNAT family N-acetyltransferase/carbon-nitrogen hydrolase family protein [soil metagenome]